MSTLNEKTAIVAKSELSTLTKSDIDKLLSTPQTQSEIDEHDKMIEKLRNIDYNIDPFAQNY